MQRVVRLADYQPKRLLLEEYPQVRDANTAKVGPASVVSLQDKAVCYASIEVDELSALTPLLQRESVMNLVREHLAMEFGALRIVEFERTFLVTHRNVEEMVGALLRVQYHVLQCTAEDLAPYGLPDSCAVLHLTWGIGSSASLAESERSKRRQHKRFTQD